MPTRRKAKGNKSKMPVCCDDLARMDELRGLGLSISKAARYLNLSESTVGRYYRVLLAIENGTNFNSSGVFNWKAINGYCHMLGKAVPQNEHDTVIEIPKKENDLVSSIRLTGIANCIADVANALDAATNHLRIMSKYILESMKEGQEQ